MRHGHDACISCCVCWKIGAHLQLAQEPSYVIGQLGMHLPAATEAEVSAFAWLHDDAGTLTLHVQLMGICRCMGLYTLSLCAAE